jgi:hypothetical protein
MNELPLELASFVDCISLIRVVGVSRSWRRCIAKQVMAIGPHVWLQSHRSALEIDALELCRLSALSSWYDERQMSVALIIDGNSNPLHGALAALDKLSCVPLPAPDSRFESMTSESRYASMTGGGRFVESNDDIEDCWVINDCSQVKHEEEAQTMKELKRQWTAAYISVDCGKWDMSAEQLCVDTLASWHSLCCCVMCGNHGPNSLSMRRCSAIFKHSSLCGTDWWKADMLIIGKWQPQESNCGRLQNSALGREFGSVTDPITALCFTHRVRKICC